MNDPNQPQPGAAPSPPPSAPGYPPAQQVGMPPGGNNSGMGSASTLPPELAGFNVGAFFMNWIWSIANNTWIGLLCLVPCLNVIMIFVLGFKGNEWAWQNRKWESVEHFKRVQKIWANWGIAIFVLGIVLGILNSVLVTHTATTLNH